MKLSRVKDLYDASERSRTVELDASPDHLVQLFFALSNFAGIL